ncbi:hypothetical protein EDB81DRAFT_761512 [Dactylonectria macrodidyma]|uniref:Uncharacterized protein n=1 Tax=Dactylonectria macrodidyma TaxID=307937 RepID=A0A9P9IZ08_9HYPO|nr:hypothetical protein EDB81DRAFT_761512 [Dactylonectria macrodidyma]
MSSLHIFSFTLRNSHTLSFDSNERGDEVVRQLQDESDGVGSNAVFDLLELDMTSFQSVQLLPSRLKSLGITQLDIAILNAGTYQTDFRVCPETGWEQVMQVNFLATAALTILLRPYLTYKRRGYLLAVASEAHAWADPQNHSIQDLLDQFKKPEFELYLCYQRYHISKLLLILWIRHISTREEWAQASIAAVSPGFASTGLWRDFNGFSIAKLIEYVFCRSCKEGAGQYVCALDDLVRGHGHGGFWSDAGWREPSVGKYGQESQDG